MTCSFDQELLTGYYDDALDARERESVDRHIAGCSDCLRQLEEIKGVVTQLKALPRAAAPVAVREEISRELATVRPASFRRILLHFSAAAAAAVLIVVTVSIVTSPPATQDEALKVALAPHPSAAPLPTIMSPAEHFEAAASLNETKRLTQGEDLRAKDMDKGTRHGAKAKEDRQDPGEDPLARRALKESVEGAHDESALEADLDRKLPSPLTTPAHPAEAEAAPAVLRFRSADVAKAREVAAQYLAELSLSTPAPDLGGEGRYARGATLTVQLSEAEVGALLARLEKVNTVKIVANPATVAPPPATDPAASKGTKGQEAGPAPSPTATPAASPGAAGTRSRLDAPAKAAAEEKLKKETKGGASPSATPAAKPAPSRSATDGKPATPDDKEKARDELKKNEEQAQTQDGLLGAAAPVRRFYILLFEVEPSPEATPSTTK